MDIYNALLEEVVRRRLGQTYKKEDCAVVRDGCGNVLGTKPNHLRFNFDARNDLIARSENKQIIGLFNDLFKNYPVILHSHKGCLHYCILKKNWQIENDLWLSDDVDMIEYRCNQQYQNDIIYEERGGYGTVDVLCEIIKMIHTL